MGTELGKDDDFRYGDAEMPFGCPGEAFPKQPPQMPHRCSRCRLRRH